MSIIELLDKRNVSNIPLDEAIIVGISPFQDTEWTGNQDITSNRGECSGDCGGACYCSSGYIGASESFNYYIYDAVFSGDCGNCYSPGKRANTQ